MLRSQFSRVKVVALSLGLVAIVPLSRGNPPHAFTSQHEGTQGHENACGHSHGDLTTPVLDLLTLDVY
jgi:hypothetical protein